MTPSKFYFAIFERCLYFDVSRTDDEARGIESPVIWTAQRARGDLVR